MACSGGSAPGANGGAPIDNEVAFPSCATTDPCDTEAGACFLCQEGAGFLCRCSDAGAITNGYQPSCMGTMDRCTN